MNPIKRAREATKLSYRTAASLLGVSFSTLYLYETGKTKKQDATLIARMAKLYGVPVESLIPAA